jgi:hypothetical protein
MYSTASHWARISKVVVAAALLCSAGPLAAEPSEHLQLAYLASFGNGSLDSSVDRLGIGPLKPGHSQVAQSNPAWTPQQGAFLLTITRPAQYSAGPLGLGLWATPVSFGQGSLFGMRGTFISPVGPHQAGNLWGVTLSARTGGINDLLAETRVAVSFQVRANAARLNVVGADPAPNLPNVPQAIYDAIFDQSDPQPFTLELLVDRITGEGKASLKVGDAVFSHEFRFAAFKPDSGPVVTAVGPSIAIANAPGQSASVRVRDFEILLPRTEAPNSASAGCPPGWAEFNCRAVPN